MDRNYASIRKSFEGFGMSFDNFSQTSRPIHTETAQAFFLDLHRQGVFRQKTTEQFYSPSQDRFLADRYIEGTCPKCANRRRPRRPVRGLRLEPRPHRAGRAPQRPGRQPPGAARDHPLVPAPGRLAGPADRHARRPPRVEGQRQAVLPGLVQGRAGGPRRDPRPELGRARAPARPRGQGLLRVVRRAHRLHLRHPRVGRRRRATPKAGAPGGRVRTRAWCTSSARTTSSSTR